MIAEKDGCLTCKFMYAPQRKEQQGMVWHSVPVNMKPLLSIRSGLYYSKRCVLVLYLGFLFASVLKRESIDAAAVCHAHSSLACMLLFAHDLQRREL